MIFQVDIDSNKLSNFSTDAKSTLKTQLEKYATDIIKEANLIEEGLRENDASTEITSSFVLQAVRKSKIVRPRRKSKRYIAIKIIAFISSLITGALFDYDAIKTSIWRFLIFLIMLLIASGTTLVQFIEEERM